MGKKNQMNILQVIPKLGFGGAETGCYDLAHYLYEKDCKSFIILSVLSSLPSSIIINSKFVNSFKALNISNINFFILSDSL